MQPAYLEIEISNKIKEDSKEYKSLLDDEKYGSMQRFNTTLLNTRGNPNKPAKLGRKMRFKLDKFDILHFDWLEIVTTSGGAFHKGKIVQENTGGFGSHNFVLHNYQSFKKLQKRFFIPTNLREFKETIKVIVSAFSGKEQKRLADSNPKILYHSPNWDCFSHFSFEEFPRLLATLKAFSKAKMGGGYSEKSNLANTPSSNASCPSNNQSQNTNSTNQNNPNGDLSSSILPDSIDFDKLIIIAPIKNTWQWHQYTYPALLSITKEHNPDLPFAIKKENIICVNDRKPPLKSLLKARNVYVPTQVKCNKAYLKDAIEFLRDFYYDENFKDSTQRIYISRAKSAKRFLENEEEFRQFLECEYGFKTLYMEEISFKDKINYLSRAKIMLSIDGTSVMNYGYMKSGTKAIALRAANMAEYPIDCVFGVEFLPIICDITTAKDTDHMDGFIGTWWASNLYANIDYIKEKFKDYGIEKIR